VPGYQMPSRGRAGFASYKETADAFIVVVVLPHGPADEAGLAVHDKIVSVNGIPASQISNWDLTRLVHEAPGTKLDLEFLRGAERHRAAITLRNL
jgi:C-terminal processing protease CtpA/Prc